MGDVIRFPTRAARDWAEISAAISSQMRTAGLSENAQRRILNRMKDFQSLLDIEFDFHIPSEARAVVEPQLENLETKIHEFTAQLLIDRLKVEAELCMALNL